MATHTIALFGEAEKGAFQKGTLLSNLTQLEDCFGNPPPGTQGMFFAIQSLLFNYHLLFFRVREEGFSHADYFIGFKLLFESDLLTDVLAIGVPGVGDQEVLEAASPIIQLHHPILITTQADLYDLLHG